MAFHKTLVSVLFIFNLSFGFSQEKFVIASYQESILTVNFYNTSANIEKQVKLDLSKEKGIFTADSYHNSGASKAMQISNDGSKLYFFLYDGYDGACDEGELDEIPKEFCAFYCYNLKSKKLTKVFNPNRSGSFIWHFFEARNTLIYYDYSKQSFLEYSLSSGKTDTIVKLKLSGSDSQFDARANGFDFFYISDNKCFKLSFDFTSRKNQKKLIYPSDSFSSSYQGKTVVSFWPRQGNLVKVITPGQQYAKIIPKYNEGTYWRNDNSFFVMEEDRISLYDYKLNKLRSFSLKMPHIWQNLNQSLFVSYHEKNSEIYGLLDLNLTHFKPLSTTIKKEHFIFINPIK